ncbi:MAG: arsenate reductase ArsC [Elusimicrobia bacterium]|nr:arsenate reductase ArsC [Elusimicrobiota bacterium]
MAGWRGYHRGYAYQAAKRGGRVKKVLFLCTGNSCRSQMAEGWCNYLHKGNSEAFSAGTEPAGEVNKYAVLAMSEVGVDISSHRSKHLDEFKDIEFDLVVTVCDNARERCPLYWGQAEKIHKSFEDPFILAKNSKTDDEALNHYRRIRDELKEYIVKLC